MIGASHSLHPSIPPSLHLSISPSLHPSIPSSLPDSIVYLWEGLSCFYSAAATVQHLQHSTLHTVRYGTAPPSKSRLCCLCSLSRSLTLSTSQPFNLSTPQPLNLSSAHPPLRRDHECLNLPCAPLERLPLSPPIASHRIASRPRATELCPSRPREKPDFLADRRRSARLVQRRGTGNVSW